MKTIGRRFIFVFTLLALIASAYAADDSPLFEAVRKGDKATVEALLAKGADVNARNIDGRTSLHLAAYSGQKDIAELLLAQGADVNSKTQTLWDDSGRTPLHETAYSGKKDIAEWLITNGADVNAKAANGETPLHRAVNTGEKDIVQLLLAKGADVNAKTTWGATPLFVAVESGQKVIAELLLAKGADVNAITTDGRTPLLVASYRANKDFTDLLDAHKLKQARLLEEARLRMLEDHIKKNPRAAFLELSTQLKDKPDDDSTRRLIIKLASELKPAPVIPEEARRHFVEGTAIVKAAKNPAQQTMAAQSFTEALKIAPWWDDAYYNLGVAQELAEKYDEAEQAFNFYLLSNPSETEKREVQDRIYGLSAKRKLAGVK